ncbi:hypothetical protein GY45DRAFT_1264423, partial [Cubamyces sp. BRFM 1775]
GYHRYLVRHMPFLSKAARHARVQWARWNRFRDWMRVIWTDESALRLGEEVIHPWVTRLEGEADLPQTVIDTHPNTKSGIMVWGCIAYGKKGPLVHLDLPRLKGKAPKDRKRGGLDAEGYTAQVLEGPLLLSYISKGVVFLQRSAASGPVDIALNAFSHYGQVLQHRCRVMPDIVV